jgi:leader peptidase (prepilin peptidase)/N-methyltransferase
MCSVDAFVVIVCAVAGLLFGSFANVVIHRVPRGDSVVRPRSACPGCGTLIAPRDNVPVLSYLALGGQCRACDMAIGLRYPLVEVGMAVAFAVVGARIGAHWALPAFLLFTWTLLVVAVIDAETRRIPNRITYPLTPALAVLLVAAALLDGDPGAGIRALAGGLVAFAVLLVLALISPRGMGMGDVKLAGFIGLGLGYLGWGHVALGVFGAFLLGGLTAIALMALRVRGRKDLIPFGPYLALAALVTLVAGRQLIEGYARLSGLQ